MDLYMAQRQSSQFDYHDHDKAKDTQYGGTRYAYILHRRLIESNVGEAHIDVSFYGAPFNVAKTNGNLGHISKPNQKQKNSGDEFVFRYGHFQTDEGRNHVLQILQYCLIIIYVYTEQTNEIQYCSNLATFQMLQTYVYISLYIASIAYIYVQFAILFLYRGVCKRIYIQY